MNLYMPLQQFLAASGQDRIMMTFTELEQILGFNLPKSAYTYDAWWANGGHSQAKAWLNASYKVVLADRQAQFVSFFKCDSILNKQTHVKALRTAPTDNTKSMLVDTNVKLLTVCGYEFHYLQQLVPECDTSGDIIRYNPQNGYDNKKCLPQSYHGKGAFCRFSINTSDWPGVYLWVVDNRIIYIGETKGLQNRFNMGYGHIAPRNCYVGGQSTNCKMNKVILSLYEQGKTVSLYFYNTTNYKKVELELLGKINTPYNVKDN